jgi:hypothetical protein
VLKPFSASSENCDIGSPVTEPVVRHKWLIRKQIFSYFTLSLSQHKLPFASILAGPVPKDTVRLAPRFSEALSINERGQIMNELASEKSAIDTKTSRAVQEKKSPNRHRGVAAAALLFPVLFMYQTNGAFAFMQYNAPSASCAKIQSVIQSEGAVVLRFPSTSVPVLTVLDVYVRDGSKCGFYSGVISATVPSADGPVCMVQKCRELSGRNHS